MSYQPMSRSRGGAWTKVVIFTSLYVLLLESLIEWVVVLYLYGNKHVDSKMAPSLIFALIGSFFTVPLVVLHSFLAWQYNNVIGYESRKRMLRTVCTYILRLTIIIWLGASVSGLVVVSQQAYCLPDAASGRFWRVGMSCALHRAVVIISVLSFLTVCLYFCSRELCERPYDVSVLGIYQHWHRSSRDGSVLSASTLKSEKSLKHDMLCICRRPDVTYGRTPYMTSSDTSDNSGYTPSIQQPTPIRPTSFLHFSADPDAKAEYLSGTTVTPGTQSDLYLPSVSRTPSAATTQTLPELPGGSGVQHQSNHKRDKSSISSLRRLLPNALTTSLPLSADPQIRALAEENAQIDLEKQKLQKEEPLLENLRLPVPPPKSPQPPPNNNQEHTTIPTSSALPRSITMNSAEAPEVVTPPAPLTIRRSSTSLSHPLPPNPSSGLSPSPWSTLLNPTHPRPIRINTTTRLPPHRHSQFEPLHSHYIPRYTQSQRYPGSQTQPRTRTRNQSSNQNRYGRHIRRNDVSEGQSLYYQQPVSNSGSGLRRPRSTTLSSLSIVSVPGHLDCIRETGASIDEVSAGRDAGGGVEGS
ncbi:hypothetical protein BDW59DRAFT_68212 [Aspergillus cavernicola]|uniref:Uncharacterized protein n=1 Tax=Aspergillus cavernicola TaxID=176166 RepID=A0ABR4IE67_9EURO